MLLKKVFFLSVLEDPDFNTARRNQASQWKLSSMLHRNSDTYYTVFIILFISKNAQLIHCSYWSSLGGLQQSTRITVVIHTHTNRHKSNQIQDKKNWATAQQ